MSCPWSGYEPGTIRFCEERLCSWVVEPSNAFSNIGYVIVGVLVLATLARSRAPMIVIGVSSILIGLGSFAFHGTGTRVGELLDVSPMYLLSGLAIVCAARRLRPMSDVTFVTAHAGIVLVSVGLMIGLHNNGIFMFAAQFATAIGLELYLFVTNRRAPSYRWQKAMIATFLTAFAIWNADKWDVLCDPHNHVVTGHAVWHVLTAVSIYCFARQQDPLV